jgi:pantothenate synthetase
LQEAHVAWRAGERSPKAIEARVRRFLGAFPDVQVEYIAVGDPEALAPVSEAQATTVVALAARVGLTRLIDNIILGEGVV